MNVSLTPELECFVTTKVQSGRYTSASEVIREALRLLEEQEHVRGVQLAAFQLELDRRLAASGRGTSIDGKAALAEITTRLKTRRSTRP
jgi:antitoxin ParD1/3/4